jgi:hypothetical protein
MDRAAFGCVACSKKFLLLLGLPVQVHVVDDDLHDNNNDQEDVGDIPGWKSSSVYVAGDKVVYNGKIYQASWWTKGDNPEEQGEFGPWKYIGEASSNTSK